MSRILLILFCAKSVIGFSHESNSDSLFYLIYSRNHFGLNFNPNASQSMKIEPAYGNIEYKSRPGIGIDFSANYTFNIKKLHGIKLNYGTGRVPISYKFALDAATYGLPFDLSHTAIEYQNVYRYFGIDYEYRTSASRNYFFCFGAGIRFSQMWKKLFYAGANISIYENDSSNIDLFSQTFELTPNENYYGHFRMATSINFLLPKLNLIRLGISANIAFLNRKNIGGNYQFINVNGYDTGGYTTLRMNYLGLDISYIFTRANRTLKQTRY